MGPVGVVGSHASVTLSYPLPYYIYIFVQSISFRVLLRLADQHYGCHISLYWLQLHWDVNLIITSLSVLCQCHLLLLVITPFLERERNVFHTVTLGDV